MLSMFPAEPVVPAATPRRSNQVGMVSGRRPAALVVITPLLEPETEAAPATRVVAGPVTAAVSTSKGHADAPAPSMARRYCSPAAPWTRTRGDPSPTRRGGAPSSEPT